MGVTSSDVNTLRTPEDAVEKEFPSRERASPFLFRDTKPAKTGEVLEARGKSRSRASNIPCIILNEDSD